MDSEQLREYGHRMVDFIADYYKTIETFPVLSQVQPRYLHNLLPESAPDHPETVEQVLDDVKAKILPGVTHWQSPSFFAYFPINGSIAGFLGEMLSAGLNTMSFSWVASPAATELEIIVVDWVAKLLNLPEQFLSKGNGGGVIQGSACEAILVVMIAARDKVLRNVGKKALEKLVVYSSDQTHSSLQKACQLAGIHLENCRVLKTDSSTNYALRPEPLQEAVSKDLEAGLIPFFLCGTVGTTSSTAVDPLAALGKIAKSNEMWFHVDAAYAGSACICPEYRQYIDGVETADSFDMNAHKWLLTNFECSLLWVKDQSALTEALSTNPEYLKNKASQANLVVDYKDWQIPLGRRFRENGSSNNALKPMDSEQLREYGHRMVDFIADYYKTIETFPVLSQVQPGYLHNLLPESAPDHPETVEQVLDDVKAKILPGVTHWQSPSFFAYFPINGSIAGFLGEMLSAGLNTMSFSWVASPAATELEIVVVDWVAKLLNLPEQFLSKGNGGGVIQGSACEAILVVMIAARDKVLRSVGKKALEKLVVYSSDQTHSSLQKACQLAGIHLENCRVLKTDSATNYALRPESLQEAVSKDLEAGLIPFFLCGTVGTTSSTAVDPVAALGKIAKSNEMWFHIDAAYAGSACICPEYRQYIDGVETADSFDMNAHKWLLTNFECSLLWVKDQSALTEALSTNPEYLKNKASQANLVVDYKDWQIPLGRRFRSLKLWMVLRLYGAENLKSYIRNHIKLAKIFEQLVSKDPNFEVVTPRIFSLVCFRIAAVDNDEKKCNNLNRSLLDAVNSSGKLLFSHTILSGKFVLRFAIGAPLTEEKHVKEAWKVIQEEASFLLSK
ncbi:hypothetical protein F2Q69_00052003 [Brassica cretica]|uniref:Tyrosine decarboxylase n=1 Tax=Brassica cretica TaxID=69181 RepID=A0A8S9MQL4_BRACR|nr:hypothetical protein F2Q69_00052003 [Brassica cretica]